MYRKNKKRKIVIYSLLGILMLMAVGYASFTSSLKIKGTSKVTSNWDIEITNVTNGTSTGSAENGKDENGNIILPTWDKLNAYITSDLYESGDSMTYVVTIENKGTLDAKLDDIIPIQNDGNDNVISNDGVKITFSGYTKGQILYKQGQSGDKINVTVKVEYNDNYTGGPTSLETNLQFNFTQAESKEVDEGEVISENSHKVTYDYITNGGNKKTYERYYQEGEEIDLTRNLNTPYDLKDEYIFKGWNINSNSDEKLETLTMGNSDVHLYAIYTPDNITINSINTSSTTNSITVVVDAIADSGIKKIEYSKDGGTTWEESTQTEEINSHNINNLIENTDYPIKVRAISNTNKTIEQLKEDNSCIVEEGTVYPYPYTGEEQTFTPICRGKYKLETWGAQGGSVTVNNVNYTGGYGGYSIGNIILNTNDQLFIVVGGRGKTGEAKETKNYGDGGYNGGGSRSGWTCPACTFYSSGGGGATHIAYSSGLLSTFNNKKNDIIMVSGGGGGNGYVASGSNTNFTSIASGGGFKGVNGNNNANRGTGGSEDFNDYFGYGNYANTGVSDGGGGGYYGGNYGLDGGGGGSGYIGNNELFDKKMVCYNCSTSNEESTKTVSNTCTNSSPISECSKQNDGYAKITLLNKTTTPYTKKLQVPTYIENNPGEITITYPQGCSNYSCSYKIGNNSEIPVTADQVTVYISNDSTITGYVKDTNEDSYVNVVSSSYSIIKNKVYISSSGSNTTGYGTINKPYASLSKAYEAATNTSSSTIYVMSNITESNEVNYNNGKNITIKSYGSQKYTITKSSGDFNINNITIAFENINFSLPNSTRIYLTNTSLNINNCTITGVNTGNQSSLWLGVDNNVKIYNSSIQGPYAIGGNGGTVYIENSTLEGSVVQGIMVNNGYCGNFTITGNTKITGKKTGIQMDPANCSSSLTLNQLGGKAPYIMGKESYGINLVNTNSTLNFNYGDIYGKNKISNKGISNYRSGTTFTEVQATVDGSTYYHSYLK